MIDAMGELVGYRRVSTADQTTALQTNALKRAGCKIIFEDQITGASTLRPGLDKALARLKPGSVLVVWRLDRLGRDLRNLIDLVNQIKDRGAHFHSLTEHIDTTSPTGKITFHLFACMAEFERDILTLRTKAGIEAAQARGVHCGRPPALTSRQVEHAKILLKTTRPPEVARTLQVSKSTLYRHLRLPVSE
jgi:DNA invertase Pin-like site-specific DNA recombinase